MVGMDPYRQLAFGVFRSAWEKVGGLDKWKRKEEVEKGRDYKDKQKEGELATGRQLENKGGEDLNGNESRL